MHVFNKLLFKLIALIFLIILFYYCIVSSSFVRHDKYFPYNDHTKHVDISSTVTSRTKEDAVVNIWCIFTKVTENILLQSKFENLMKSLFSYSTAPLHIHVICDNVSEKIAKKVLDGARNASKESVEYSFYDVGYSAQLINDIVQIMMPHFSSQPGTYYSDALFYLSLGLHRIAPQNQSKAIMLDCDVQFTKDVLLLYKEFERFTSGNLFGLAHELTPVYRHILYAYRNHRDTTFGEYVHSKPLSNNGSHPFGFPGYNSGVMLFNLSAIRKSVIYTDILTKEIVDRLTEKYKFKGHLGDQDFYTILGYEYPDMFRTIPCNFNRQLCVWWRDHGYSAIFGDYSKCDGDIAVYHGNCNTPIPV